MQNRNELIKTVVEEIETAFPGSVVVWTGTGLPDSKDNQTDEFEAFMIKDEDYIRFEEFVWNLEKTLAQPNGFSLMIHGLSPQVTEEYRKKEYLLAIQERERESTSEWSQVAAEIEEKTKTPGGAISKHSRKKGKAHFRAVRKT